MSLLTLLICIFGLIHFHVFADVVTEAIVGGHYAKIVHFKYQVSIQFHGSNHCGGAIIDEYYILTAAHCVTSSRGGIRIKPYTIIAGTDDLKDNHAIVIAVETVYVHKDFNRHNFHHDVAVLKLKNGLNLSAHSKKIEKINLPKGFSNFFGVNADVAGFGLQSVKGQRSSSGKWEEVEGKSDGKLKHAKVKIIPYSQCIEMNKPQNIFTTFICGQVHQRNKHHYEGVCDGDSGGPLVHKGEVIGILNTSPFACNETSKAAIYTNVFSYLNLIQSVISGKPDDDVVYSKVPSQLVQ